MERITNTLNRVASLDICERSIRVTAYKNEYDRALERAKCRKGRYYKTLRHSTVEPVFGTLINFMGMRKINTRGIESANKVMLMAAMAYNLKKLLKYQGKNGSKQALSSAMGKCHRYFECYNLKLYLFFRGNPGMA